MLSSGDFLSNRLIPVVETGVTTEPLLLAAGVAGSSFFFVVADLSAAGVEGSSFFFVSGGLSSVGNA